ncbi:MAG: hypothetical protein WCJ39_10065, partial [bacterium]
NCEKLQEFQRSPRYEGRYVASIKTDTKFLVNLYSASGHKLILKDIIKDLRVCKLCLSFINYKNYRISTRSHDLQVDEFKLQEFFDLYKSTSTKSTKYTSETMPLNDYPKNWNEISNNLRVKYNYICQDSECPNRGISFSNNPGFIHVHHLNHLKSDCREENLKVLCGVCHAKIHPHMKGNLH